MIRLVISDLWEHATTWVGAFIVAIACGYIGGWVVSLHETALLNPEELRWSLQNAATMMLAFSAVAGIAVLTSAANLAVSVQKRSYALWQIVNVRPALVSVVIFAQLLIMALLGALCGTFFAAITFEPLFPLMFSGKDIFDQVVPYAGVSRIPVVWIVVGGIFLCGGLKGALNAGRTSPLAALREQRLKHKGMTWMRSLLFVGLTISIYWVHSIMIGATPYDASSWAILIILLVTAALAAVVPLIFSSSLILWTSLVPQKRWNAWYLARHNARYSLESSLSVETPIMVGFALVAGLMSILNMFAEYYRSQGVSDVSGWSLDLTTALILLGGPMLLCTIGAAISVVMSSRSRTHDVALLTASGARPLTLVAGSVCEAFIHTVTATLIGGISVLISSTIVAHALSLPFLSGITFGTGFLVSSVGFILLFAATLIPTLTALDQSTSRVLTTQE